MKITKNPDEKEFLRVSKAVLDNNGYCPCKIEKIPENRCPCREFIEQPTIGFCHCGKYYKEEV